MKKLFLAISAFALLLSCHPASNPGDACSYWSSSLTTYDPSYAWSVYFFLGDVYISSSSRYYGFSVRPVSE